jgi:hypothetical protein
VPPLPPDDDPRNDVVLMLGGTVRRESNVNVRTVGHRLDRADLRLKT